MKKSSLCVVLGLVAMALGLAAGVAAAAGVDPVNLVQHALAASPDVALGLSAAGAAGMLNFVQPGDVLDLDPGATVPSGTGCLFGAALFGVAAVDAVSGTKSAFVVEGVVTIAKTSALAISVGDRLFWDATNKVVNKTTTAQQQVGIAVEAASNPSATVKMLIESAVPVAT
jgi:predicted RecA/RadA family phage recombinase